MDDLLVLLVLLLSSGLQADGVPNSAGPQCEMPKADIVMLVDSSGSISNEDFKRMKSFISQIVQNFHIGPNEVQIGLTQYSFHPKTEWYLNTHKNKQSLLEAINDIKQMTGGTMTGLALDHILNQSFKPAVGMRADSKKYVVLITDGAATDNVAVPAKKLKDTGIKLYVVGVGPHVQNKRAIEQLKTIASEDVESHVYLLSSFQSTQNISTSLCHGATKVERLPRYNLTAFIIRLVAVLLSLLLFACAIYCSHKTARGQQRVQQNNTEAEYYNISVGEQEERPQ